MSGSEWRGALVHVARLLNAAQVDWMLLGSAATAFRGALIKPGDIDVATATPDGVHVAATVLPTPTGRSRTHDPKTWYSSTQEPVLTFGDSERWTFGRWHVDGVKVELAHIEVPSIGDRFLETASTSVWSERAFLELDGITVPVVPIEAQIATMLDRGQWDRLKATVAGVNATLIDADLLRRALTDRQIRDYTSLQIPQVLRNILART